MRGEEGEADLNENRRATVRSTENVDCRLVDQPLVPMFNPFAESV
jgi:hypothetical protein